MTKKEFLEPPLYLQLKSSRNNGREAEEQIESLILSLTRK
jgi:hypothetical protein